MTNVISVAIRQKLGTFELSPAFDIPASGISVLFGPSGCGKSATLLAIAGLSRPDHGRIAIGQTTLFDSELGIDIRPEHRAIGFVFQDSRLFPHMSVKDNLEFGSKRRSSRTQPIDLEMTISLLGLEHLLDRRPHHLSGGEKQRVAIGRALLSAPSVLVMDEPMASLDDARKAEILPFLERLHQHLPVPAIYVTHALDEAARIADAMVIMDAGRIVCAGSVVDVLSRADVPLLANRGDVGAVLLATVVENDPERGLSHLAIEGIRFVTPLMSSAPGRSVRIRILARDVAIATRAPEGLSMQNVLPARISQISPRGGTNDLVRLDLGGVHILALVTSDSVRRLGLKDGSRVFALVKSVASGVFA